MKTGSLRADRSLSLGETLEGVKEHVRTNCETSPPGLPLSCKWAKISYRGSNSGYS